MDKKFEFERAKRGNDFEHAWLSKLSRCLKEVVGENMRNQIMEGDNGFSSSSRGGDVIAWTREAVKRMENLVEKEKREEVLTGCACQYPTERLEPMRKAYAEKRDLNLVHGMLQQQFLSNTSEFLRLDDGQIEDIRSRGWGVAGVRKGNTIIATKMPFEYHEYVRADASEEKRYRCCHCPRIREVIRTGGEPISATYCYCGAGFYRRIWEHILQRQVRVEVLESVLQGDELCKIAIHLPSDA